MIVIAIGTGLLECVEPGKKAAGVAASLNTATEVSL
jgi:hypothetical protein